MTLNRSALSEAERQMRNALGDAPPADMRAEDVLITGALEKRPRRSSSLQAESAIHDELTKLGIDSPEQPLAAFLEVARRLCNAGSAGLSVVRTDVAGNKIIRWESIAGALHAHEGSEAPQNASPCGVSLETHKTVLMWRPERAYHHLTLSLPPIVENLIVPLHDADDRPLGTLWVTHHDTKSAFCANDARVLEQLAIHFIRNLKLREAAAEHLKALALLDWHRDAQRTLTLELAEERALRRRSEASEKSLRQTLVYKEAAKYEAHHRVKNTLQIAASLLAIHARTTTLEEVRAPLREATARLILLGKVHELLYRGVGNVDEVLMSALLDTLGGALRTSFTERAEQITLKVESELISLVPLIATPLALFANEVMTNAYKHAFPGTACGEIHVHLSRTPQNALLLRISDDGVGMIASDNPLTLGVRLVRIFAKQLGGELSFSTTADLHGTTVTLLIPPVRDEPAGELSASEIAEDIA